MCVCVCARAWRGSSLHRIRLFSTTVRVVHTRSRKETKLRFRKRAVLANVPSFRFLVPGNIRMYLRSSFFGAGEHPPKPPLWEPPFCKPPKRCRIVFFVHLSLKDFEGQGSTRQP